MSPATRLSSARERLSSFWPSVDADGPWTGRGTAATATWIFRGDATTRRDAAPGVVADVRVTAKSRPAPGSRTRNIRYVCQRGFFLRDPSQRRRGGLGQISWQPELLFKRNAKKIIPANHQGLALPAAWHRCGRTKSNDINGDALRPPSTGAGPSTGPHSATTTRKTARAARECARRRLARALCCGSAVREETRARGGLGARGPDGHRNTVFGPRRVSESSLARRRCALQTAAEVQRRKSAFAREADYVAARVVVD